MSAATDNIGLFFGEDIFIAIASILLIKGFLEQDGIIVEPLAAVGLGHPHRDRRLRSSTARGCCCSTGARARRSPPRRDAEAGR